MKRLSLFAATLLSACAGSGTSSVSLSARAGPQLATTTPAPAATGLSISRVRVALRKIELRSADRQTRVEINAGPMVIDLSGAQLDGGVHEVLDGQVPPGTYRKIEIEIEPSGLLGGRSVVVNGTFNGSEFEFSSSLEAEQEREGTFPIGGDSANITVDFDPASWFVRGTTTLDPRDPANRAAIEANVTASINAFEDDDHSGRDDGDEHDAGDDDGGHGGDDGGGHH
jgi:Domain of unknown function (DUF4382)